MGAKLCTLRHLNRGRKPIPGTSSSMIMDLMKPCCLKTGDSTRPRGRKTENSKRKTQLQSPEKKITKVKKISLEEWLSASPGKKPDRFRGGELHVFKHSSKTRRVHPSSRKVHTFTSNLICEARDSITLDRPQNHDGEKGKKNLESSCIRRSQSGKSKKVSFRLPEEADIITFYSPPEGAYYNKDEDSS
ncbi:Phospholipase C [Quillaja saponaria]|uniref:Phospholipase C n=1 Tax=Quillaja saponaria TaxID=32244 RepID=A0AAD7M0L9_QUISA|nr:Phospholipase C [Quillaja saponaria]